MIVSKKAGHSNFNRLVNYVLDEEKEAGFDVYNVPSRNPDRIAQSMDSIASLNDRAETKTFHVSISWPDDDNPSKEQMLAAGKAFLEEMDLAEHQSVVVAHEDTDHNHIHVVANRIHPEDEKAWNGFVYDGNDKHRSLVKTEYQRYQEFTATMEKANDWRIEPGRYSGLSREQWGQSLSQGEYHSKRKAQEYAQALGYEDVNIESTREIAHSLKDELFKAESFGEFDEILASKGLHIEAKGQGAVFRAGGEYAVKASDISRQFSGQRLEQRFDQDLQTYCKQRDGQIKQMPTDRTLKKFDAYIEEQIYDDIEEASRLEGDALQTRIGRIRAYDHEIGDLNKRFNKHFERLYTDPNAARQAFHESVEAYGYDQTMAQLAAYPESFGDVADRSAQMDIIETQSDINDLKGQYSNTITQVDAYNRQQMLDKLARRLDTTRSLQQNVAGGAAKGQALGKLQSELSETDSGQVISSALATSVRLSKMGADPKNDTLTPMKAGLDAIKQANNLTKGEGGKAVEKVLQGTGRNIKLAADIAKEPTTGTIKALTRVVQSGMNKARSAGRSAGRGM